MSTKKKITKQEQDTTSVNNDSVTNNKAVEDKVTSLEARVSYLEDKLYVACEGLHRIGFERDGNQYVDRWGVDASAARTILRQIGNWNRTISLANPAAALLSPPTIQQQQVQSRPLSNPVTWSKDPSFRGVY